MIRLLDKIVEAVAVLCFVASTLMIISNVIYRYVVLDWLRNGAKTYDWLMPIYQVTDQFFGSISVTADEVPGLLLVWIAFLGAYLAMRAGGHISFDVLVDMLSPKPRRILQSFVNLVMAIFLTSLLFQSIRMIRVGGATEIETADIAQGWFMLVIPIFSVLLLIALAIRTVQSWKEAP